MSYIKEREEMSNDELLENLKKPHKAYDWDVATQNVLIARLAEVVFAEKKPVKKKEKDAGSEK